MDSLTALGSGAVTGSMVPKEGADAIPAPADGKNYPDNNAMDVIPSNNSIIGTDDASTTELLSSAATSPPASVMSDPFNSSPASSFSSTASSLVFPLKSILKNGIKPAEDALASDSEDTDEELSDDSESESESEAEEDSVSNSGDWEDESDSGSEDDEDDEEDEVEDDEYDGLCSEVEECVGLRTSFSFISFSNNVRFAETETIIIATPSDEPEPVEEDNQVTITCHERMLLAQASQNSGGTTSTDGKDYDSEEHTRDLINLDKDLFIAYLNGLSTVNARHCKTILRSRTVTVEARTYAKGRTACGEADELIHEYLDRIVQLVLGFFPNLFTDEEFGHLLDQAELAIEFDDLERLLYLPEAADVQNMLQDVLQEKLFINSSGLFTEILPWLAGELLEPLGRRASSRNEPAFA